MSKKVFILNEFKIKKNGFIVCPFMMAQLRHGKHGVLYQVFIWYVSYSYRVRKSVRQLWKKCVVRPGRAKAVNEDLSGAVFSSQCKCEESVQVFSVKMLTKSVKSAFQNPSIPSCW